MAYNQVQALYQKRAAREAEEMALAFELVLGTVHPSHLGALPPSPAKLKTKALPVGLI